ncbi:oxidoreductase [Geothrix terrae]|uniref:oxidoreductase n=1 Tax=Geothrix terrae TaxID=2922720 RepID=UPI001FAD7DC6|nr:oxidoreductase [Geothrix terrae]
MPSPQTPLPSGFGPATTAREVLRGLDLSGRVAVVTGGSAGLGLETTRALAEAGATVVVPARNVAKARAAVAGLPHVEGRVEVAPMDLLDPASIDAFAVAFLSSERPLAMLINNAGIMATPLTRDARGYEAQFAANHLGHFQLTARLWPALLAAGDARVVALSSRGHQRAGVDFDDPNFERRPYDKWQAYGQAKSANVLFAVGLDRRGEARGVRAFAVHPGVILTDLGQHMTDEDRQAFGLTAADGPGTVPAGRSVAEGGDFKNAQQGAATSVWAATSPQLAGRGGVYCQDCDMAPILPPGAPGTVGVRPHAIDPEAAERLWALSERLTGVRFAG